jgi:hypothetical protein
MNYLDNVIQFDRRSFFLNRSIRGQNFEKWIMKGPCNGLLKLFLDSLVKDHDETWSFQSVRAWSSSSNSQQIYNDGFAPVYNPPRWHGLIKNGVKRTALDYFAQLIRCESVYDHMDKVSEYSEAWGVLHYGLLASHYGHANIFGRVEYTRLLLSVQSIALSASASSIDDAALCNAFAVAIVEGMSRAQLTTTLVANASHVTFRLTGKQTFDKIDTKSKHDPLELAIRFSREIGNIMIPNTIAEAKLISATAHLMEVPCKIVNNDNDTVQNNMNFIYMKSSF